MIKKARTDLLIWVILALIVAVALGWIDLGSITESFTTNSETNSETTNIYEGDTINSRSTNLCSLFQPYIVAGDTANECNLLGGDWTCREDFVGCTDTSLLGIDCSGVVIKSAMVQCSGAGGEYTCDPNNAYCIL